MKRPISQTEFWIIQAPISLFFGWGTVCAVSNLLSAVISEQMKINPNAWDTRGL